MVHSTLTGHNTVLYYRTLNRLRYTVMYTQHISYDSAYHHEVRNGQKVIQKKRMYARYNVTLWFSSHIGAALLDIVGRVVVVVRDIVVRVVLVMDVNIVVMISFR